MIYFFILFVQIISIWTLIKAFILINTKVYIYSILNLFTTDLINLDVNMIFASVVLFYLVILTSLWIFTYYHKKTQHNLLSILFNLSISLLFMFQFYAFFLNSYKLPQKITFFFGEFVRAFSFEEKAAWIPYLRKLNENISNDIWEKAVSLINFNEISSLLDLKNALLSNIQIVTQEQSKALQNSGIIHSFCVYAQNHPYITATAAAVVVVGFAVGSYCLFSNAVEVSKALEISNNALETSKALEVSNALLKKGMDALKDSNVELVNSNNVMKFQIKTLKFLVDVIEDRLDTFENFQIPFEEVIVRKLLVNQEILDSVMLIM